MAVIRGIFRTQAGIGGDSGRQEVLQRALGVRNGPVYVVQGVQKLGGKEPEEQANAGAVQKSITVGVQESGVWKRVASRKQGGSKVLVREQG